MWNRLSTDDKKFFIGTILALIVGLSISHVMVMSTGGYFPDRTTNQEANK